MGFQPGSIAAVCFIAVVVVFLGLPILVAWIQRVHFARRFERVVREGHVVPIIRRNEMSGGGRRRVTPQSLMDAVVTLPASSVDDVNWKPVAVQYIVPEKETPLSEAILTTPSQRKEAKQFLKTLQRGPRQDEKIMPQPISGEAEQIRTCILILMPSSRWQFQGEAVVAQKKAQRFAATSSGTAASRISSEGRISLGEGGKIEGLMHCASAMAMMHIEIGIEGSKVSGHSEVYKLLNEGTESFVSLEAPNVDNIQLHTSQEDLI